MLRVNPEHGARPEGSNGRTDHRATLEARPMAITTTETLSTPARATSPGAALLDLVRRWLTGGPRVARSTYVPRSRRFIQPPS